MAESAKEENLDKSLPNPLQITKSDCIYTKCYCEENVWKLCKKMRSSNDQFKYCYAVFISNPTRTIPIWCQQSSQDPHHRPVVWDYHVILVFCDATQSLVYDLDTVLPFPVSFNDYVSRGFRSDNDLKQNFKRFFRVIEASTFLETFASDRSHMHDEKGNYMHSPPSYPCIIASDGQTNNLDDFVNVENMSHGIVLDFSLFLQRFSK